MATHNPFYEQWRECLRTHYKFVLNQNDTSNEKSLETVLLQVGFTNEDIRQWRREVRGEDIVEEWIDQAVNGIVEEEAPPMQVEAATPDETLEIVQEIEPAPVTPEVVAQEQNDDSSSTLLAEKAQEEEVSTVSSSELPIEIPSTPIVPRPVPTKKDKEKPAKKGKSEKPDKNDQMSLF
jgi:hypothetical protein